MGRGARAAPDGSTILIVASPFVINPALYETVPYDPVKDFDPVTLAVTATCVIAINPSVPAGSVTELVALIKANPGRFSYASPGAGTIPHLVGELFRLSLGLDLVHVPFNSGGLAIGSTVAGHTPVSFGVPAPAVSFIADGSLRALAVTSKRRSKSLPDVPTMTEERYPEIEGDQWYAVVVPAGTPRDVIANLHHEFTKLIALPDIERQLATLGFDPIGSTPAEFAAQIKFELDKWTKVIHAAGLRAKCSPPPIQHCSSFHL
jgi:tripartite-type tricarboxylate transporter receptor subunit TctC